MIITAQVEIQIADRQNVSLEPEVAIASIAIILGIIKSSILEDNLELKRTFHTRGLISENYYGCL